MSDQDIKPLQQNVVPGEGDAYRDRYEDADLYRQIDKSQRNIPWWLIIMVALVILMAIVLNAPFLGKRGITPLAALAGDPGADGGFLDVGMLMALLYVGGGFAVIFWYTFRHRS